MMMAMTRDHGSNASTTPSPAVVEEAYKTVDPALTPRASYLDNQANQAFCWFVRPCIFKGTTLSFVDYVKEFPYFRDMVLPILEARGLRQPGGSKNGGQ